MKIKITTKVVGFGKPEIYVDGNNEELRKLLGTDNWGDIKIRKGEHMNGSVFIGDIRSIEDIEILRNIIKEAKNKSFTTVYETEVN